MATNPKMLPCPRCGLTEHLDVITWEDVTRNVQCTNGFNSTPTPPAVGFCGYRGPAATSIRYAIQLYNDRVRANQ